MTAFFRSFLYKPSPEDVYDAVRAGCSTVGDVFHYTVSKKGLSEFWTNFNAFALKMRDLEANGDLVSTKMLSHHTGRIIKQYRFR